MLSNRSGLPIHLAAMLPLGRRPPAINEYRDAPPEKGSRAPASNIKEVARTAPSKPAASLVAVKGGISTSLLSKLAYPGAPQ